MESWLEERVQAIKACLLAGFAEAALALVYSGIDTEAYWIASGQEVRRADFIAWCDTHLVPLLGKANDVNGIDLYGARCGILHTSSASSQLGRTGDARELYYHFKGRTAVNLRGTTPRPASIVDVECLARAFEKGSRQFLADLQTDEARLTAAKVRADKLFTWGVLRA